MSALLEVEDLKVHFPVRRGLLQRQVGSVKAVDGVSFRIDGSQTLGLVGESGCGKSTTGRAILRLVDATGGRVTMEGTDVQSLGAAALRKARRTMQMIFQDPYASLNPRMTVLDIVAEPLWTHGLVDTQRDAIKEVSRLMERTGLSRNYLRRYPHEFSGGQRQRVGIARALALGPKLIVADEPVSALDMSIRAQIINLLVELQEELGVAYLFIAHDLAVVRHISHEIAVMYLGRIVEQAGAERLFAAPTHPYTQALLSAIPVPDPAVERKRKRLVVAGDVPSPLNPPSGCAFHTRCPHVMDICRTTTPMLEPVTGEAKSERVGDGTSTKRSAASHRVACHLEEAPEL